MKTRLPNLFGFFILVFTFVNTSLFAQSPTNPAKDFNVFTLGNTTLSTNETEGPIAIGGDLTISGSYQVAIHDAGTFKVNNVKIGLLVNGKVNYQSGNSLQVNSNGYVKIGNANGSTVWYADQNNATPPIRITPNSDYNSSPRIMLQANAPSLGVSVNNNPVFQSNLLDFASAFQTMKATSLSISQCTPNVQLTNPNGQSIPTTNLPNQVKINLQNGINYWNITAADLNAVQIITFNNKPTASKVLVINVDATGTFNWNVWNQAGIGFQDCPYIMYNFYNTTKLNITNGSAVEGTVFAPFADIVKGSGNQSNIEGQVIANSFSHSGGEVHYALFSPTVAGCAAVVVGVAPTANFSVASSAHCLATNSFNFTNETTPIQANLPLTYLWEFGDGTTSTSLSPTKVYSAAGTYNVKLTATNSVGSSSKTIQVTVNSSTNASVSQSTLSNGAGSLTQQFVLSNSAGFTSYSWSVSNGGSGLFLNQNTVSFSFTQAGSYEVTVTGVNDKGCTSTTIIPVSIPFVIVGVAPTANFSTSNSTQCLAGNSFTFTNATTPIQANLPLTYLWEFGDGTTSTSLSPTKVYAAAGIYNVKLTATNNIGSSSKTVQVIVNNSTDAIVSESILSNAVGSITKQFVLTNSSSFTNYSWSVSNGASGVFTNQNTVNFSFTQAGVYQVTVAGINVKGCSNTTVISVSIAPPVAGVAPTTKFGVNAAIQCLNSNSYVFTNASATYQCPTTTSMDAPYASVSAVESQFNGIYFSAEGRGGNNALNGTFEADIHHVTPYTVKSQADFVWPNNQDVTFSIVYDPTASGTDKYIYTLGSGATQKIMKFDSTTGNYPLEFNAIWFYSRTAENTTLLVSDLVVENYSVAGALGAQNPVISTLTNVLFRNASFKNGFTITGKVKFAWTGSLPQNSNLNFNFKVGNTTCTPVAVSQPSAPLSYAWDFGDGTTSTLMNPTKVYANSGSYAVQLTTTNMFGSDVKSIPVTVNSSANAIVNQSTISNGAGSLTQQFVLNNNASFTNYSWSVSNGGSGLFANQNTVNFVFTQAGNYQVIVTGINDKGCSSTTIIPVSIPFVIAGVAPISDFTVANLTQCLANNSFTFSNATTPIQANLPLTYLWEFGDGTTSTALSPTKVFTVAGIYNVKLTATNSIGSSSKTLQVTVNSSTDAIVNQSILSNVIGSITKEFVLSNSSSFTNYSWSLSNGASSVFANQDTVNFAFTQSGNYQVTVTGVNDKGCTSTTIIPVTISAIIVGVAPTADFSVANLSQCLATNSFDFINATTPLQVGLPLSYVWEFGDGTTSTFLNPTKVYATSGVYNVKLTATNNLGSSSKTIQVTVNSSTAAIVSQSTLSNAAGTLTKQFLLSNASDFTNYSWSISNGALGLFSNQTTANFTFTQSGYYEVTVTGINSLGCSNATIIPVTIASNEVNTGNAGGVESESLGDIMSKQYVSRKKKSIPTEFVINEAARFEKGTSHNDTSILRGVNGDLTMTEMFPSNLQTGDIAHITSPTDILDFTIAQEVLSVDFAIQGVTKAVVLGVRTKDKVYNHTKASCDRLRGAEIMNVKTIKVGGYNFLIQAIKQRNGVTEYAISFCIGKNYSDAQYSLQSNWYVKEFTPYKDVYNFQVWATLPEQTTKLVNDILNNIKSSIPLVQSEIQKIPKTFASKVTREGTELVLKLKSTEVEKSIEITMDQNYSETNGFTERYNPLKSELEQTIRLAVADSYEFDGLIRVEGEIQDAFYHADGNWGLDYDPKYTLINKYRVSNNLDRVPVDGEMYINRNVNLQVFSEDDYATLYKSLLPGQLPADYNDFKFVSFTAKGSGLLELGLIKSSVENWKHQYKAMVNIGEDEQTYYVPFKFFTSAKSTEKINANDLTMLTFTFLPVQAKTKNLDLTISDVKFTNKAPEGYQNLLYTLQNEFIVYPNPSVGNVKCVLFSDVATTANVSLYDVSGKTVYSSEVKLKEGKNELDFNFDVPTGVMLLNIKNDKINFGTSKIFFK